ncbi:hypothetical protein MMC07_005202 [Pseudocyphellaria aurata]|nr:hypothetical protein [Pseudocyphellaria aurata]
MAPILPEPEGRTKKESVDHLKRDQPLFAARRSVLSQQPPEFFTDSLINTSSIPIPSPSRENTRSGIRSKPRPKSGSRSLAASFNATSEVNDENQRPSTSPSLDRRSTSYVPKIHPAHSNARGLAKSPSRIPRAKTPSPERGCRFSIVTPTSSASSPPRGLAEAYQRINDEESLAQEDSIEVDMDTIAYDFASQQTSRELDRRRMQRIQDAVSPVTLKASRKPLPRVLSEELRDAEARSKATEGSSHESDSESAISNLDNLSENLAGKISQHAKDVARINGATKRDAKVFTKARSSNKVGQSLENLKRRNGSNESLSSALGAGSTSSKGSNSSLNVPYIWGKKAKPGLGLRGSINNKSGRLTGDKPQIENAGATILEEQDQKELLEDWVTTAAESVNPSKDIQSLQQPSASRKSTPMAASRKKSLESVAEWEINDDDFTGRSLQVSDSPPIRARNAGIDRVLEREIDNVAKRAVTTSRLGALQQKTSEDHLGRRSYSQSAEDLSKSRIENDRETVRHRRASLKFPLKPFVEDKSYSSISGAVLGSRGDRIPDSPITIYRRTSDVSSTDNGQSSNMDGGKGSGHRPLHERGDYDLLRKFARASSQSPMSTKEELSPDLQREPSPTENIEPGEEPSTFTGATDRPGRAAEEVDGNGKDHLPEVKIGKPIQDTPLPSKSNADLKTPLITGAWIDTPLPTGRRGLPMPTLINIEDDKEFTMSNGDQSRKIATTDLIRKLNPTILSTRPKLNSQRPLKDTGPLLPKSALESILAAAKSASQPTFRRNRSSNSNSDSEELTLDLGDSTIQSLEDILHEDSQFPTVLSLPPPSPSLPQDDYTTESQKPEDSFSKDDHTEAEPLMSAQKSRLSELQSYARQMSRLGNVGPSIRDARRRLSNLEKAISKSVSDLPSKSLEIQNGCDEAGEFHDFIWPCERCGCPGRKDLDPYNMTPVKTTVPISVPKFCKWQNDDWRPRLTWLGLATLIGCMWWIGEWVACELYCHPEFANKTFGYGVDITSPRPPFVLFKVIDRLCRNFSIIRPFYIFFSMLVRTVFSLLGYLVGFVFGGDEGAVADGRRGLRGGRIRQPVSRDPRIPRPNYGPDLSMLNDEYL